MRSYAPRILLVEDEPLVLKLFESVLASDGYYVRTVGTARHALRLLAEYDFDIVVVDLSLPDDDGVQVISSIRSDWPYLRILATSGMMVGVTVDIVTSAGANATLAKPAKPEELTLAVYRLLDPQELWRGR